MQLDLASFTISLKNLATNEYLQFLIATHYQNYADKKILLSIYDTQKRLVFNTQVFEKMFKVSFEQLVNLTPLQTNNIVPMEHILQIKEDAMDYVLKNRQSSIFIMFEKYNNLIGVLNVQIDPIYDLNNNICGLCVRSYEFTKLMWLMQNWSEENAARRAPLDLSKLTLKQQEILFLLAINFTQEKIAEVLSLSRGSIARHISRINSKFNLEGHSATYILSHLGRQNIISSFEQANFIFKPFLIRLDQDLNKFWSSE